MTASQFGAQLNWKICGTRYNSRLHDGIISLFNECLAAYPSLKFAISRVQNRHFVILSGPFGFSIGDVLYSVSIACDSYNGHHELPHHPAGLFVCCRSARSSKCSAFSQSAQFLSLQLTPAAPVRRTAYRRVRARPSCARTRKGCGNGRARDATLDAADEAWRETAMDVRSVLLAENGDLDAFLKVIRQAFQPGGEGSSQWIQ
jgi:hypothetical protein